MSAPRFFSPNALPRPINPGTAFDVGEAVARHLQVLRVAAGDTITLFDGEGGEFAATLVDVGKRSGSVILTAFDPVEREAPIRITLVQALATSDKMDLIVQKAVELGVTEIAPIATARATLRLDGERAEKRVAHWQAIAVAACEQCGRNRVPLVHGLQTMGQWLSKPNDGVSLLMHPSAEQSLLGSIDASKSIALLIGPEGGFAEEEMSRAVAHGVVAVKFGPRTLRTETAGLAAIAALAARFGDLDGPA
ncbi:MAG: 16S rRNA (uracil(1498)-N(3))-methyltransferase [Burkholderiales bacterium]|nr:16S rRNA (uracil(1498)-N(3))-methyltransferase [Burkholderiales bacterium]